MINCSIHNYKTWMASYLEGSLNKEDMRIAESFFLQYPNLLDEYLIELEEFSLLPEEVETPGKEELEIHIVATTSINENNFSQYFVDDMEGELDATAKMELQSFLILNPSLQKEHSVYTSTKLFSDTSIVYPNKKGLLKRSRPAIPLFWSVSAAASVMVILGLYFLWPSETSKGSSAKLVEPIPFTFVQPKNPVAVIKDEDQQENVQLVAKKEIIIRQEYKKPINETPRSIELAVVKSENIIEHIPVKDEKQDLVLAFVPEVDKSSSLNNSLAENTPKKKGLLNKILNGDKLYIEDYVNATFSAFKNNRDDDDKWVLKVDRDESGKSKKVKFTSPIFSIKGKNQN